MKSQSTEEMVKHIRAILEQNQNSEDLVQRSDIRTLSLEALISNFLEEAVSMAVNNADEGLFQNISQEEYTSSDAAIKLSSFNVDAKVQRILQIESPSWEGVVKDLIEKSSPIYRMCMNSKLNMVGVKDRPVAFKDFTTSSRKVSVFPSVNTKLIVSYIPRSVINTTGKIGSTTGETGTDSVIDCDDLIYEGACFYCAYLVAMVQNWATNAIYRQEAVEALKMVNVESVKTAARSLQS